MSVEAAHSESLARARKWASWEVRSVGVDTMSYAWWPGSTAVDAFVRLPKLVPGEGNSLWLPERVAGAKLGCWPTRGKVVVEGRLAVICHPDNGDGLASPASLDDGHQRAVEALASVGVTVGEGLMRRCDLAADLGFDNPADGKLLLRAWSGVALPRYGRNTFESTEGRVETVYARTPKRRTKRQLLYDKGAERGSHEPGRWLRLERPVRWDKGRKTASPEDVTVDEARRLHLELLRPWLKTSSGINVAGPSAAKTQIEQLRREGKMTPAVMFRLLGVVDAYEREVAADLAPAKTLTRWRTELRRVGVCVDPSVRAHDEAVNVRPFLDAIDTAWSTLAASETAT